MMTWFLSFSALAVAATEGQPTVQPRVMDNQNTLHLEAGALWLHRFDLFESPGLVAQVTSYNSRTFAWDYATVSMFFTYEPDPVVEIYQRTGFKPTRHSLSQVHLGTGPRFAFAYGKFLIEGTGLIIHFVPEASGHFGLLKTDRGWHFSTDLELSVRIRLSRHFELSLAMRGMMSFEERTVFAVAPSVLGGVKF